MNQLKKVKHFVSIIRKIKKLIPHPHQLFFSLRRAEWGYLCSCTFGCPWGRSPMGGDSGGVSHTPCSEESSWNKCAAFRTCSEILNSYKYLRCATLSLLELVAFWKLRWPHPWSLYRLWRGQGLLSGGMSIAVMLLSTALENHLLGCSGG